MGVYKRPNSRKWWLCYYAAGERIQESAGTRSKAEAIQALTRRKDELKAGTWRHPRSRGLRCADVIKRYMESATFKLLSPKTRTFYKQRVKYLSSYFGEFQVLDIRRSDVERYRLARKSASPTTLHHELTTLFTILRWGVTEQVIPHLPFSTSRLKPARAEMLSRILSPDEERAILAVAQPYQQAMIIAALDAGMIKKEIYSQRWADVDLGRGIITMTDSKKGRQGRQVPLTARFSEVLRGIPQKSEFVFTYKEKPILSDTKKSWYRILADAKVDPIRFQDLRASYNTRLEEIGVPPAVSMALMGHRRQTVRDRYTRPTLPMLREAIDKLNHWLRQNGLLHRYYSAGSTK